MNCKSPQAQDEFEVVSTSHGLVFIFKRDKCIENETTKVCNFVSLFNLDCDMQGTLPFIDLSLHLNLPIDQFIELVFFLFAKVANHDCKGQIDQQIVADLD